MFFLKINEISKKIMEEKALNKDPVYDRFYKLKISKIEKDNTKINKELNWYPMTSFKDGLEQTIDFYKNLL